MECLPPTYKALSSHLSNHTELYKSESTDAAQWQKSHLVSLKPFKKKNQSMVVQVKSKQPLCGAISSLLKVYNFSVLVIAGL